jgi:hypothetical protein
VAADPPLADFEVSRADPDGPARIYACRAHLAHTRRVMQDGGPGLAVTVAPANRDLDGNPLDTPVHGCKGHMESWPTT